MFYKNTMFEKSEVKETKTIYFDYLNPVFLDFLETQFKKELFSSVFKSVMLVDTKNNNAFTVQLIEA